MVQGVERFHAGLNRMEGNMRKIMVAALVAAFALAAPASAILFGGEVFAAQKAAKKKASRYECFKVARAAHRGEVAIKAAIRRCLKNGLGAI